MRVATAVSLLPSLGALAVSLACARNPDPMTTAPQRAPAAPTPAVPAPPIAAAATAPNANAIDVAGSWSGTVDFQGQTLGLEVNLQHGPNGRYTGDVTPHGGDTAPLTSLSVDGNHLVMHFAGPDGDALFDMMLTADRQAFTGTISYTGQQVPFTARRRP